MSTAVYALVVGLVIALPALGATAFLTSRARVGDVWQAVASGYKEELTLRDETIERLRSQAAADRERLVELEARVAELAVRDQGAVLVALHELAGALEARDNRMIELLEQIAEGVSP